jgi:hypothetical protein
VSGWARATLLLLAAVVVFAVGLAVGEALHDNPKPGITLTTSKTVEP